MKVFLAIINLLFSLRALKTFSFLVYLWQLKEYRWDRLWLYCQTSTGKQEIRNQLILNWRPWPVWRPQWTKRASLLFGLSLVLFSLVSYPWLRFLTGLKLLIGWLVLSLTLPVFVLFASFLVSLPARLVKRRLVKQAKEKIKALPELLVIGITGSYGKTATVHILAKVLSTKYRVLQTPENQNTLFSIAQVVNNQLKPRHQIFIVEMGAYKKGEIAEICQLVKPKIGIVIGINYQHLGLFKTFGSLLTAKYELIKALPKDGLAVFNAKNRYTLAMAKKTKLKTRLFATKPTNYPTNLIGFWQQQNIDAALAVAQELKVPRQQALKELTRIPAFPQQVTIKTGFNRAVIIDDSYSINPDGFMAALKLFKNYPEFQKIVITSGLIELGYKQAGSYRLLAKKISLAKVNQLVLLKQEAYDQLTQAFKKISRRPELIVLTELPALKDWLKTNLNNQSVILLEGRMLAGLTGFLTCQF
ncbi:hypothetical protein KKD62_00465 [Patescibacteria group bacterium]|nr:hypothetical protein [Patescibacteria group bacterium]MBU1931757.1 hypothetical protein [Patescibacteria group bacterium]